jgi:hypothetical protein
MNPVAYARGELNFALRRGPCLGLLPIPPPPPPPARYQVGIQWIGPPALRPAVLASSVNTVLLRRTSWFLVLVPDGIWILLPQIRHTPLCDLPLATDFATRAWAWHFHACAWVQRLHVSREPPLEMGSCNCNTSRGALLRGALVSNWL